MSTEYIERGAEPKPRYIDINAFFASENVNNVYGDYWELKERLDEVPAAEVEPVVHAHWEWKAPYMVCSACNRHSINRYRSKRCQHCGAHMLTGESRDEK